jgi:hypothetical protein
LTVAFPALSFSLPVKELLDQSPMLPVPSMTKKHFPPKLIPRSLFLCELVICSRHCPEESVLFNKRQQRDPLPRHLLSILVELELLRIEMSDGRRGLAHEWVVAGGECMATTRREHTHELLERLEWLVAPGCCRRWVKLEVVVKVCEHTGILEFAHIDV